MTDAEFLAKLKELALAFDREHGSYPESAYEGLSFLHFAYKRLTGHDLPQTDEGEWDTIIN